MTVVDFVVPGRPVGKGRPRLGAGGRVYTPRETTLAEQAIREAWINAGSVRLPDGPIQLRVTLGCERPQGHFKKDGTLSTEGLRHPYPARQKPDLDNAVKLTMDALNSRAWRDDVQVVKLTVDRVWTPQAFTAVEAAPMGGVHVLGKIGAAA